MSTCNSLTLRAFFYRLGLMRPFFRWARNAITFYCQPLRRHRGDATILKSGRPAVILLYGWGHTKGTVSILEGRLAADGFAPLTFPLGGLFGRVNTRGVEVLAVRLKKYLQSLLLAYDLPRAAIIGHSIGGLIGRYLVTIGNGSRLVHTLVTLGSPHKGSPLARAFRFTPARWISPSVWQLVPGSDLLRRISNHPIPREVYCAALFSRGDHYCPPQYAKLDKPEGSDHIANIDVGDVGHVEYVVDENVYELIREQLMIGLNRAGITPNGLKLC